MLKALLLDLDGVLRVWRADNAAYAEQATGLPAGAILEAAFTDELLQAVIRGCVTDEAWRQQIVAKLRASFPKVDARQAVKLWSASPGEIDSETLELARVCRRRITVVLVTNATSRLTADLEQLGVVGEFDHIVNSSDVGFSKPRAELYQAALQKAGVAPHEAYFVDDSAENVAAARELGIAGHVFDHPDGLRRALTGVGLLRGDR